MDSDNILSILSSLGGGEQAPTNVLQQMAPMGNTDPSQGPYYAPPPPPQPAAPVAPPSPAAAPAPKQRRSLLDTIGRISDVLAKVGGAEALYQPTLDAREDRSLALGDHARLVDLDALKKKVTEQQVAAGILEPQVAERKRIGTALSALVGHEDTAADLWPHIAEQAGIDPQRAAALGQMIANNPASVGILAKSLGADTDNLGKNVFFGTTDTGKTVAYQVGPDGKPHVLDFGGGITPNEPIKVVDSGGSSVVIGGSGKPKIILPKTIAPGTAATIKSNEKIAGDRNATAVEIAGMPARSKGAAADGKGAVDGNVPILLDNIMAGFADLHKMNALPGEGGAIGQIEGAFGRSGFGQKIGEQVGTPSAQKRLEIMKNVSGLQQAMLKSLPASATRTKFEQEMLARGLPDPAKMSYKTAQTVIRQLRESYQNAVNAAAKETAPKTPVKKAADGWTIVGVK